MNGITVWRALRISVVLLVGCAILTGLIYPLVVLAIGRAIFGYRATGSIVSVNGKPVGSELIGQKFERDEYFHPRPSAVDYDASKSGAADFGPTNGRYIDAVTRRAEALERKEGAKKGSIPVDLVTSSGSGLDPDITPAAAHLQAARVARARGIPKSKVDSLIGEMTAPRTLGFLGENRVNVLLLNIELDKRFPSRK